MDGLDVRGLLENALDDPASEFQGAFSFHRPYPDAPNPVLSLSDLGVVGLPLSARDAGAIKSKAIQAPFGMGERTVVDKSVRDTWEMDGKSVTILNPSWDKFVLQTVKEVCESLAVEISTGMPRAELYKLLLYETGSHFLPHVDSEKADGMFATIIIVLPSAFTGGAVHLSHGGVPAIHDIAPHSQRDTTVLAWYSDVQHEVKPITSGYRLALSYNLIHTSQSLRPALSPDTGMVEDIASVLKVWSEDTSGGSPEKIIFMLDHKYCEANLSGSVLKGRDAYKAAVLAGLAHKFGFSLGLANANCHLTGETEYHGGGYRSRGPWSEEHFAEEPERKVTLEHFVDLEGKLIADQLEYAGGAETIPVDLSQGVEAHEYDEEHKGFLGNTGALLQRWYRRTAFVIWPKRNDFNIMYKGLIGFQRACDVLISSMTMSQDRELADLILSQRGLDTKRAADVICQAAYTWNDVELWKRAIKLCCEDNGVAIIAQDRAVDALKRFGLHGVRESFQLMLKADRHNGSRLTFLKLLDESYAKREDQQDFTSLLDRSNSPQSSSSIHAWVLNQTQDVLASLSIPETSEIQILLSAAMDNGGLHFFRNSMLPQLLALSDSTLLLHLAYAVFASAELPDSTDKLSVVSTILKQAILTTSFFEPKPYLDPSSPTTPSELTSAHQSTPSCAVAEKFVSDCVDLGCSPLISDIIDRVTDISSLSEEHAQECAKDVMLPLAAHCANLMRNNLDTTNFKGFEKLQQRGVDLYLDAVCNNDEELTKLAFERMLNAVHFNGHPTMFLENVLPRLLSSNVPAPALQVVVEGLQNNRDRFIFPRGYMGRTLDNVITSFCEKYALEVPMTSAESIVTALNWCVAVGHPDLCQSIIERFMNVQAMQREYVSTVLIPLLPEFRKWAAERGPIELQAPVFSNIIRAWFQHVLGPLPVLGPDLSARLKQLDDWNCNCNFCRLVRSFLRSMRDQRSLQLDAIGCNNRAHIEKFLLRHARGLATFETITGGRRQGSVIYKAEPLYQHARWWTELQKGPDIINSIGTSEDEVRPLLGSYYDQVLAFLKLKEITLARRAATRPSATGSNTGISDAHPSVPAAMASASSSRPTADGSSTGVENPPPEAEQRPAKKRKMDPKEIIDLT